MSKKNNFGRVLKMTFGKYMPKLFRDEVGVEEYVKYGDDNLFPEYLITLLHGSSTHSALCTSIATMIFGKGAVGSATAEAWVEDTKFQQELRKTCMDLKLQGGFYWELKWNIEKDGLTIKHVPFEQIRVGETTEKGYTNEYFWCYDWSDEANQEVITFPAYNPENANKLNETIQIFCCKPFTVGSSYYPKPDYLASINWIEVDKQVALYHNANLRNGMNPGFAVNWKSGVPPLAQRQEIRKEFEDMVSGVENAGNFIMTWSDSAEDTPDIVPFETSNLAEQFQFVSQESTAKIMIGHRVTTPALFGVKTEGQLGQTQEMKNGIAIFHRDIIQPYQAIINEALESLSDYIPDGKTLKVESNEIDFDEPTNSKEVNTELSMTADERLVEYMQNVGEQIDSDVWELLKEEEIDDPLQERFIHHSKFNMQFFKRFADPDKKSEIDTGLFKIRYRYSTNLSSNSRLFCKNMVANAKAGTIYRFEDIQEMQDAKINSDFAPKGSDKYSIWLHKGGVYCHHRWIRQVYMRKRGKNGGFLPNKGLENDEVVSNSVLTTKDVPRKDLQKNWNTASTRPIDTPSRGALN